MKQIPTWSAPLNLAAIALSVAFALLAVSAEDAKPATKQDCAPPTGQQDKTKLSSKLDDCNGVLEPPKVGDKEIVAPTPHTGTMPVVKPGELPPNKNP
ncbi:hypothetical protein [Rhizobium leguminosarum]|uniref:hypothetical protein n=1 Tax=Rhizobium leguminosarum TaxID=384 RepID=UPI001FE1A09A|nr:hypothetical protein [Rhizobium leguminosarum]